MAPVPYLDWPADLFTAANISAIRSISLLIDKLKSDARFCACGCGFPHQMAVSGLDGEHGNRSIVWFRTTRCKSAYMERLSVH